MNLGIGPRAGWRKVKLSELGSFTDGDWILNRDYSSTGVRLLQVGDVGIGRFVGKSARFISKERADELKCTYLHAGDILISRMPDPIGRACRLPELGYPAITAVDVTIFRPASGVVEPDFILAYFNSREWLSQVAASASGATRTRISRKNLERLIVRLPPIAEQKRIAATVKGQVETVETIQQASSAQRANADRLEAAYFRKAFHGRAVLTVDLATPAAPEGWRWHVLEDLAKLESGHTPSRNHSEWWAGDVPWLALPDIRNLDGKIALDTVEHTNDAGLANSSARLLPTGTVCLSRTASVGFVTILGRPMATSQDFVNWICGPNLDPRFLMHVLRASRGYIRSLASGAIHKTVYVPTVKAFKICASRIDEQRRIAASLDEQLAGVARTEATLQQTGDLVAALAQRLMHIAFFADVDMASNEE